jgi:hypothetical protein
LGHNRPTAPVSDNEAGFGFFKKRTTQGTAADRAIANDKTLMCLRTPKRSRSNSWYSFLDGREAAEALAGRLHPA